VVGPVGHGPVVVHEGRSQEVVHRSPVVGRHSQAGDGHSLEAAREEEDGHLEVAHSQGGRQEVAHSHQEVARGLARGAVLHTLVVGGHSLVVDNHTRVEVHHSQEADAHILVVEHHLVVGRSLEEAHILADLPVVGHSLVVVRHILVEERHGLAVVLRNQVGVHRAHGVAVAHRNVVEAHPSSAAALGLEGHAPDAVHDDQVVDHSRAEVDGLGVVLHLVDRLGVGRSHVVVDERTAVDGLHLAVAVVHRSPRAATHGFGCDYGRLGLAGVHAGGQNGLATDRSRAEAVHHLGDHGLVVGVVPADVLVVCEASR